MAVSPPKFISLIGPTASGKSDLALALAHHFQGQILSADSMQVYRHMDIGTAKPTPAEQLAIPHHLINLVDPTEEFTVARFVDLADQTIATITSPLIVTGGTPLYYKSLFEGLFEGPPANESLRNELRTQPNESLHQQLQKADPAAAARIHLNDTKRLIRALEVFHLTGRPITSFQTDWDTPTQRHPALWIGLLWDKDVLNRRINARVKSMIAAGWLEETRSLLSTYGTLSKTAAEATGYAELISHLQSNLSLEDAIEQIKIRTRQLARRQMKWFKRFPNVHWLPGDIPLDTKLSNCLSLFTSSK